jgi:hypothetical protein
MCRCTQERSDLKIVMLFDRRNQTYCLCSHNLDAEDASQEVAELRRDGLPAFSVDQRSRHSKADPEECSACQTDIKHSIKPLPASNTANERSDSAARTLLKTHRPSQRLRSPLPET